jgi:hypothetical protein
MKKHTIFLLITCLIAIRLSAQKWVVKEYLYDSFLNQQYKLAPNFNGQKDTLRMDIYMPKCPGTKPLLLLIHGGAFLAGDKNDASIQALCKSFARRGYVTASIGYRLGFVSDDNAWSCNYPNYNCVFATDTAEWVRSYYRAVQDGKSALQYLINRHKILGIDTSAVFVAGESAGGFLALGVGLMDNDSERPKQTYAINDAPRPHSNTLQCSYNIGKTFSTTSVSRPDLGDLSADIEPATAGYTIKAIGNIFGGMLNNLLAYSPPDKPKPAIWSFHRPCDLIVPIDSARVYQGLSWCLSNGYNCYGIANMPIVYGSRAISRWNTRHNYGYEMQDEFTNEDFPYSFLFGSKSCLDQASNPCHAYDDYSLRETNMARFFAKYITSTPPCSVASPEQNAREVIVVYPNPASSTLHIEGADPDGFFFLKDVAGRNIINAPSSVSPLNVQNISAGVYFLVYQDVMGQRFVKKIIKTD